MVEAWNVNHEQGTAVGPSVILDAGGVSLSATALWSDAEGVVVALDVSGDVVVDRGSLGRLREATAQFVASVEQLLNVQPPVERQPGSTRRV